MKALYTELGECAGNEEVIKAVLEWITASDLCARASDEDFPNLWQDCSKAQDRLHQTDCTSISPMKLLPQ